MSRSSFSLICLTLLGCLLVPLASYGVAPSEEIGPSNLDLQMVLPAWSGEEADKLVDEARKIVEKTQPQLTAWVRRVERKRLKEAIKFGELGELNVQLMRLDRLIELLQLRGETTAAELRKRHDDWRKQLNSTVDAVIKARKLDTDKALPVVEKRIKQSKDAKVLDKIKKLLEDAQPEKAEALAWKAVSYLEFPGVWSREGELRDNELTLYQNIWQEARVAANKKLQADLQQIYETFLTTNAPDFKKFTDKLAAAGKGETPILEEAAALSKEWQELHTDGLHSLAWEFSNLGDKKNARQLAETLQTFPETFAREFARLIALDAAKCPEAEVRAHYQKCQELIAAFPPIAGDAVQTAATAALAELAAKDPELQAEIAAEEAATAEVLRWRARIAERSAERASRTMEPLLHNQLNQTSFQITAAAMLARPTEDLLDRRCIARDLSGSELGPTSVVEDHSYFKMILPKQSPEAEYIAQLRSDLLLGEDQMPLSWGGYSALARAEHGEITALGAQVAQLTLVGAPWLCIQPPRPSGGLNQLGSQPFDLMHQEHQAEAVLQIDLAPVWIHYPFGFYLINE